MILAETLLVGLLLGLIFGGSIRNLQYERLKGELILLVLLPLQLLWPTLAYRFGLEHGISLIVWLLMMAILVAVLLVNVSRRWMLVLAGFGIALNVLVIGLNGAMPVSMVAVSSTGMDSAAAIETLETTMLHEVLDMNTLLPCLGDIIPVPGPEWQRGVVSVGDILLSIGLTAWLFTVCKSGASFFSPGTRVHTEE